MAQSYFDSWQKEDCNVHDKVNSRSHNHLVENVYAEVIHLLDRAPPEAKVKAATKAPDKFVYYRPGDDNSNQNPCDEIEDIATEYPSIEIKH